MNRREGEENFDCDLMEISGIFLNYMHHDINISMKYAENRLAECKSG